MMLAHPGVSTVHDLHVWASGSKEPVLAAHLVLDEGGADVEQVRKALAAALDQPSALNTPPCRSNKPHAPTSMTLLDRALNCDRKS